MALQIDLSVAMQAGFFAAKLARGTHVTMHEREGVWAAIHAADLKGHTIDTAYAYGHALLPGAPAPSTPAPASAEDAGRIIRAGIRARLQRSKRSSL